MIFENVPALWLFVFFFVLNFILRTEHNVNKRCTRVEIEYKINQNNM